MALTQDKADKPEDPKAQVARLREQVDALMVDRITPSVTNIAAKAQRKASDTTAVVRSQTQAIAAQVQQRPLTAMLVAAAVGWLICRVTR